MPDPLSATGRAQLAGRRRNEAHPRKAEALRLLGEGVSPADVARRLDVNPSTVRMWKTRAKAEPPAKTRQDAKPASGSTPSVAERPGESEEIQRARVTIRGAEHAARLAIRRLHEVLPRAQGPQAISVAAGVMIDKAQQLQIALDERLASDQDQAVRLAEQQAELVHAVIRAALVAHRIDPNAGTTRRILRTLLQQASRGEVIVVSPADSEEAQRVLRDRIRSEVRREIEAEIAERESRPALPAPAPEPTDDERLREWQVRHRAVLEDAEEVDGEVVPEPVRPRRVETSAPTPYLHIRSARPGSFDAVTGDLEGLG